ncbi:MAG TPA: hypothetical protein VIN59_00020 [Alphaproteobacteria bacterium]
MTFFFAKFARAAKVSAQIIPKVQPRDENAFDPEKSKEMLASQISRVALTLRKLGFIYSGKSFDETEFPADILAAAIDPNKPDRPWMVGQRLPIYTPESNAVDHELLKELRINQNNPHMTMKEAKEFLMADIANFEPKIVNQPRDSLAKLMAHSHGVKVHIDNEIMQQPASTFSVFWPVDAVRADQALDRVLLIQNSKRPQDSIVVTQWREHADHFDLPRWYSGREPYIINIPASPWVSSEPMLVSDFVQTQTMNCDLPDEQVRAALQAIYALGYMPSSRANEWPRLYLRDIGGDAIDALTITRDRKRRLVVQHDVYYYDYVAKSVMPVTLSMMPLDIFLNNEIRRKVIERDWAKMDGLAITPRKKWPVADLLAATESIIMPHATAKLVPNLIPTKEDLQLAQKEDRAIRKIEKQKERAYAIQDRIESFKIDLADQFADVTEDWRRDAHYLKSKAQVFQVAAIAYGKEAQIAWSHLMDQPIVRLPMAGLIENIEKLQSVAEPMRKAARNALAVAHVRIKPRI